MALLEALLVGPDNERQVREGGRRGAERLVHQNLLGSVRDMVGAPHDVRHAHLEIVGDHTEMISGMAVGAQENEVFDVAVFDFDVAEDLVVEACFARLGDAEAHGVEVAGGAALLALSAALTMLIRCCRASAVC